MVVSGDIRQRIARLTALAQALAHVDALVAPVAPRRLESQAALGATLAEAVLAPATRPPVPVALRDGWAVASEATLDAGTHTPTPLAPAPAELAAGDALPAAADAVAPLDAVEQRGDAVYALAPVAPGEGVLPAGGDAVAGEAMLESGRRLSRVDLAALAALRIAEIAVRAPRVRVVPARQAHDDIIGAIATFIAGAVASEGAITDFESPIADLDHALADDRADAMIIVGGSGSGPHDRSVQALARAGRVAFHGVGLAPGETAAFGMIGQRPVLVVPGRLDAALAVWLTLGRRMLARLCARAVEERSVPAILTRKISSTLGLAELVLVRREAGGITPIASRYLPLQSLARADGFVLVPPEHEGYPEGARVEMRLLP
jgi:molybdopterin molybdotransferase